MKKYSLCSALSLLVICLLTAQPLKAQTVTGTVADEVTGELLPGVNIVVKGAGNTGTSTDSNGEFSLDVPSLNVDLVISFVGYQTNEVALDGRETINLELRPQI